MLSVVIPTYRGAHRLARLFASMRETCLHSHPFDAEILVGDDGSPAEDGLAIRQECTKFHEATRLPVHHMATKENRGPVAMLRTLVDAAKGTRILQLDDDVRIPWEFWAAMDSLLGMPNIGCLSWRSAGPNAGQSKEPTPGFLEPATELAGYCFAYGKSVYDEVGGIDTRFRVYCSDSDFALRVTLAGHPSYRVWWPLVPHDEHMASKENEPIAQIEKASQSSDSALFLDKWGAGGGELEARAIDGLRRTEGY